MSDALLIGLIGVGGIIVGSVITILGSRGIAKENQNYELKRLEKEHKKRIEYMKFQWTYEERIKNYKKIIDFLGSQENIINGLGRGEIDFPEFKEYVWEDLIKFYKLNPEYYFFNSKDITILFEEYVEKMNSLPKEWDGNKIYEEFVRLRNQIKTQIEKEIITSSSS